MQDTFADRFSVGIMDADKRRPGYLSEFRQLAASEHMELFELSPDYQTDGMVAVKNVGRGATKIAKKARYF